VVNHYPVAEQVLKLRIRAGHHRFELSREGYEPVTRELEAIPGELRKLEIVLEQTPADAKPDPGGQPC